MKPVYYTEGSVRGSCPHMHRSLRAAARCVADDMKGCARQGGYSDRDLVRVGGWPSSAERLDDLHQYEAWLREYL